jgi:hypothetical protein
VLLLVRDGRRARMTLVTLQREGCFRPAERPGDSRVVGGLGRPRQPGSRRLPGSPQAGGPESPPPPRPRQPDWLVANREAAADWETFRLVPRGPRRATLQAHSGLCVAADANRGGLLVADRGEVRAWEEFEVVSVG